MCVRVLQLSDLHLCAKSGTRLHGVPTRETLRGVLEHIRSESVDFDHVIITGDLADDGEVETYRTLRVLLKDHLTRCRLLPGNQDDREHIRRVFPEIVGHNNGPLNFAFQAGDWRLIGLDTLLPGAEEGYLSPDQLNWLSAELAAFVDMPTVIFLHHPPVPVYPGGEADLNHPERFLEIVTGSPQVKVVCAGHVHYASQERVGHTSFLTTPSTAFQYRPAENDAFDLLPPGYRICCLEADSYHTEVVRLPALSYAPAAGSST